jgi:hypothetical protein
VDIIETSMENLSKASRDFPNSRYTYFLILLICSLKSFEFLPKAIEIVSKIDSIVRTNEEKAKEKSKVNSGVEYKDDVLGRICQVHHFKCFLTVQQEWPRSSIITFVSIFRDIPMTQDQLKKVIEKISK